MSELRSCDRCKGSVSEATAGAIEELGQGTPLNGVEQALAQTAMTLARAIDSDEADNRQLAGLTRELRATLRQLAESAPVPDEDADEDSGPR